MKDYIVYLKNGKSILVSGKIVLINDTFSGVLPNVDNIVCLNSKEVSEIIQLHEGVNSRGRTKEKR